jgi:membrane-bound lytic murein transglycosylase E
MTIRTDDVKLRWFAFLIVLLAGCSSKQDYQKPEWNPEVPVKRAMQWMPISEKAGEAWGVSPRLVTAIIAVESGGNPNLVSKSNAVGLMQLKASTAGREVYRHMGWSGQPSTSELKNPERNISMGTAYLSILEHGILKGIEDPEVMQYALVVSYVNGALTIWTKTNSLITSSTITPPRRHRATSGKSRRRWTPCNPLPGSHALPGRV